MFLFTTVVDRTIFYQYSCNYNNIRVNKCVLHVFSVNCCVIVTYTLEYKPQRIKFLLTLGH